MSFVERLGAKLSQYLLFRVLKRFGFFVSGVVNFFLLFPVYFVGVGCVSLLGKLFKTRFLDISIDKNKYWEQQRFFEILRKLPGFNVVLCRRTQ